MATKTQVVSAARTARANTHLWLGLVLTPGLGPTRGRKLAEHCGGIEKVFQASLTELEAAGLRAHSAQSIATGKSQRGVRLVLGHHGLLDHFVTIKTADDAPSKPDPGMVIHAMRDAGVDAANTIVVGDTVYDIAMARAAGASAVGVTWGYHRAAALTEAGAFAVVDEFPILVPTLEKMWTA